MEKNSSKNSYFRSRASRLKAEGRCVSCGDYLGADREGRCYCQTCQYKKNKKNKKNKKKEKPAESKIEGKIREVAEYNKANGTALTYGEYGKLALIEKQKQQKSGAEAAKIYLERYKLLSEEDRNSSFGREIRNDINNKVEFVYNSDLIDVLYYLYVHCYSYEMTAQIMKKSVSTIRNWHAEALEIFAKEVLKK